MNPIMWISFTNLTNSGIYNMHTFRYWVLYAISATNQPILIWVCGYYIYCIKTNFFWLLWALNKTICIIKCNRENKILSKIIIIIIIIIKELIIQGYLNQQHIIKYRNKVQGENSSHVIVFPFFHYRYLFLQAWRNVILNLIVWRYILKLNTIMGVTSIKRS